MEWTTAADWDAATTETTVEHPNDSVTLADGASSGSLTTAAQSSPALAVPNLGTTLTNSVGTTTTVTVTESLAGGGTATDSRRFITPLDSGLWYDDFEDGLGSEWTVDATHLITKTNRVYEGEQSVGIEISDAIPVLAQCQPSPIAGGQQIAGFRFYWQEGQSSYGGGLRLKNSQGESEVGFATDNPQWIVHDANGTTQLKGDDSAYGNWVETRFVFNWEAGTFSVRVEDFGTGTVRQHSGPLKHGSDVETISLENYSTGWGTDSNCWMWYDSFAVEQATPTTTESTPFFGLDGAADSDYSVTLDLDRMDDRYEPSVASVSLSDELDAQPVWSDTFNDDSLPEWDLINGDWDDSDNTLYNTSGENNSWISRPAAVDYGRWSFTHYHGPQFYGAKFVLSSVKPPGDTAAQPDTCYKIQFSNSNNGYDRYLTAIENGATKWKQYLGGGDDRNWHSITLVRVATDDGGARWSGSFDNRSFVYEEAPEDVVEGLNYLSFQGGSSGHRFDSVSVSRDGQQTDDEDDTDGALVVAPVALRATSRVTTQTTVSHQSVVASTTTATSRSPTQYYSHAPSTPTTTATHTTTAACRPIATFSNGVSVLDLVRLMLAAPVETGARTRSVHQHQVFDGAIEHNDAARHGALTIERTTFPGSVRRVPSAPTIRLRAFNSVTDAQYDQTALAVQLRSASSMTTGHHASAIASADIVPVVALDSEYDIGQASATLGAVGIEQATETLAGTATATTTATTTVTDHQHDAVTASADLFAPYRPIGNSVYPLTMPTVSADSTTAVGKEMNGADVQAIASSRPAARATTQKMETIGGSPLAVLLDAKTPYHLARLVVDIADDDGTTLQPDGSVPGGIDTTEDVIFGSRFNGLSMQ
ncbi:hypothetical protein [Haladaptatus cibarius]|uniref:hypothetical protein n=1 Tax=Haladaptatus cibarius TaxID=453847 RepID=UPI000678B6C4|nr:hypothetical protein [Haladaptatus cibarius]